MQRRRRIAPFLRACFDMIPATLLILVGIHLACGLVFAIPFALIGAGRIDPHAAKGSWGFRLLIIPGTMVLWPLLLRRWVGGVTEPPEESNAHRRAVWLRRDPGLKPDVTTLKS